MNVKIDEDGNKIWFNHLDQEHRVDGPAVEYADGGKAWYLHGLLHRTDGPAVEYADGTKEWYLNGLPHRTDGHAFAWADGHKIWFNHLSQEHRVDGPAVEYPDGSKKWCLNGNRMSFEQWLDQVANTEQEKTLLMLKFG